MFSYFRYTQINIFKRKSIWISVGLFWLYLIMLLLFVPKLVKIGPAVLWNNTIFDLQSFSVLILSIVCSIVAVVVFRDGREDGSELIVMSKPIARWKIILVKFLGYGLTILILIVISMLIMLCTMFFGKFDPITNPLGMDFSQLRSMETGLLLGCLVICLFFGGVAILISVIAPKVIIMISTIGLAILFNLVYMLAPILSVTSSDYLSDKYSVGLGSVSYMGIDGEMHDSVFANHVRFFTDDHDDSDNNLNTYYYVNEGNKHATGALVAYGNVGQQLSGLFHTFDKSNDGASASSYGSTLDERYWLTENKPVYENPETNSRPWASWTTTWTEGISNVQWTIYGCNLNELTLYSIAGMTNRSLVYIRPNSTSILSLVTSKFYGVDDFVRYLDNAKLNEYIQQLETDGFGYAANIDQIGNKNDQDLRTRVAQDLFENTNSKIYYENTDFPLPYKLEKNNHNYDDAMNVDFLIIWYAIARDVQNAYWAAMDNALNNYSPTGGLPPFNQWTDKKTDDGAIVDRLSTDNPIFKNDPSLMRLRAINTIAKNYRFEPHNTAHFWSLSTSATDVKDSFPYCDSNNYINDLNIKATTSDVFSSLYSFDHKKYYNVMDLTIFWSTFSAFLFCLAAIIYARTDFK